MTGVLPVTTRQATTLRSMLPLLLALVVSAKLEAQSADTLSIRGHTQSLRIYGARGGAPVIVSSGDGGWIHLGPDVAAFLSSQGYFVVGFDSKQYLSSFTKGGTTLREADVPGDYATLAKYASQGAPEPPLLVGVSEGAALSVLAATNDEAKATVAGVIALGLPDQAELGWRFRDSIIYITKGAPKEPSFSTAGVIDKLAPLPVVAIHSTRDEFVKVEEVQRVMGRALDPKQLWFIEAGDHRFKGKEQELNQKLLEAIAWIRAKRH